MYFKWNLSVDFFLFLYPDPSISILIFLKIFSNNYYCITAVGTMQFSHCGKNNPFLSYFEKNVVIMETSTRGTYRITLACIT